MSKLNEFIETLAKDLSENTYSFEYIKERLNNLISLSQAEPEVIGQYITEPTQTEQTNNRTQDYGC